MALSITTEFFRVLAYSDCLGTPAVGFIALKISTKHLVASELFFFLNKSFKQVAFHPSLLRRPTVAAST